jgi:Fe2+ transport system protein B
MDDPLHKKVLKMGKKEQLKQLEIMLREGKKREEIEQETGIKKTDISVIKPYISDLKSIGTDEITIKYKYHFQKTEQEIKNLKDKLKKEEKTKESLQKEVDFHQQKLNQKLDKLEQDYYSMIRDSSEILKEHTLATGEKFLKQQKNVLSKIDYEPQKTAWHRFLIFAIFPLMIVLFFQQWQLKRYHDTTNYTPSEIEELQKYQVNQALIDAKNQNWLWATKKSGNAWISQDFSSCAIKWTK